MSESPEERRRSPPYTYVLDRRMVAAVAGLVAVACLLRYGASPHGFISAVAGGAMVALAALDLATGTVPNRAVLPSLAVVLVAQLAFFSSRAPEWLLAPAGAGLLLLVPMAVRRDAVGAGDVKLALLMGASLGYGVLSALTLGSLALLPVAAYTLFRRESIGRESLIPFGPFLAFGTVFVLLAGGAE